MKKSLLINLEVVRDYAMMTAGAIIIALATNIFLVPNKVITTGFVGIAMLAFYTLKIPIGAANLILNLPLFIAGLRWGGGWRFLLRTIYATVIMSASIDLSAPYVTPVIGDPLIYTIFGGCLEGLGAGLVLRAQGTTGGTDIIALILHKFRSISFGSVFLVVNTVILLLSIPIVGLQPCLYAMIVNYISARVLDTVQQGLGYARAAIIISEKHNEIRKAITHELSRGVTVWLGAGGYTGNLKTILYTVVARSELTRLKRRIAQIDQNAFVAISDTHDVMGEGFVPFEGAKPVETIDPLKGSS